MLTLRSCPKGYTRDQDKAVTPERTVARVKALLGERAEGVLAGTDRVDTGRLGIPVFVSRCGPEAARVMPTRKQMGKGASPDQAEASALMELVERYSFFSYWADPGNFQEMTWSQAVETWPGKVLPVERLLQSVGDGLDPGTAREVLDLVTFRFAPVLDVAARAEVMVPLDWFKLLNEFNGSSAGNTPEESVLQGACELVERHVSDLADRERGSYPTIDPASLTGDGADPVLAELYAKFTNQGLRVVLKDFSMGFAAPTVAAVAWDPATFPGMSEIVFTAGTSAGPAKAAIRALTEVAQLAGDFETGRVYEASGLPKFTDPAELAWLEQGPLVPLSSLPDIEDNDIHEELVRLADGLAGQGFRLLTADITHPEITVPANYNLVPGFGFRERARHGGLGLFIGRMLAESAPEDQALAGLDVLARAYPGAHFLPFFQGLVALRLGDAAGAAQRFETAAPLQPGRQEQALARFYQGHSLSLVEAWDEAGEQLTRAVELDPELMEAFNLRGVSRFKAGRFEAAAEDFQAALDLDSGQPQVLANLGMCMLRLERREAAEDYLDAALAMDPSLDWARTRLEELRHGD